MCLRLIVFMLIQNKTKGLCYNRHMHLFLCFHQLSKASLKCSALCPDRLKKTAFFTLTKRYSLAEAWALV